MTSSALNHAYLLTEKEVFDFYFMSKFLVLSCFYHSVALTLVTSRVLFSLLTSFLFSMQEGAD